MTTFSLNINTVLLSALVIACISSGSALAEVRETEYTLSAHLGAGMAPLYVGASKYTAIPVIGLEAGVEFVNWGSVQANENGLTWQLPINSPFGIAFLASYDRGRDEEIRASGGKNKELKGMGDLKAAPEIGISFNYREGPYSAYLKGMTAASRRTYGGEDLGHTSWAELGGEYSLILTHSVSASFGLATSWADSKYLQGHFGVTHQQARHSQFQYYKPGAGMRDISYQASMSYQFTPSFSLLGAVGGYYLVGDAASSPLTKSRAGAVTILALSYTF